MSDRKLLSALIAAVLDAGDPGRAVRKVVSLRGGSLRVNGRIYRLGPRVRFWIVGAGKGVIPMARALQDILGERVAGGIVVTKSGYGGTLPNVVVREAGHPLPDRAGAKALREIENLLTRVHPTDLAFVLISGGGSSLLPAPAHGISLRSKQRITEGLLRSGATIQEINSVRKHLSRIKGGGLLRIARCPLISLILSDVVGDRIDVIASGPTEADPSRYQEAISVLRRYHLWLKAPLSIRSRLLRGHRGRIPETVKPKDPLLRQVQNVLIGSNREILKAAARTVARSGARAVILTASLNAEAREAGKVFGALAREIVQSGRPFVPPVCLISGGETTVTVTGQGRGGRCQEFVLSGALEIQGLPGIFLAAISTDGTDGPPPRGALAAAGAFANGQTVGRAGRRGIDATRMLENNDSYSFFEQMKGLLFTGPTRIPLNDLYLLMIRKTDRSNRGSPRAR